MKSVSCTKQTCTCTCVFSLNRLNKLCWSTSQNNTESKWSKSHELKLITRLEDFLILHFTIVLVITVRMGKLFYQKRSTVLDSLINRSIQYCCEKRLEVENTRGLLINPSRDNFLCFPGGVIDTRGVFARVSRQFKQIASAGPDTAAGSKFPQT